MAESFLEKLTDNPNKRLFLQKKQSILEETQQAKNNDAFEQLHVDDLENIGRVINGKLLFFGKSSGEWMRNTDVVVSDEKYDMMTMTTENLNNNPEHYLTQQSQKDLLTTIVSVWAPQANNISAWLWFKWYRQDDENINTVLDKINTSLKVGVPINPEILLWEFRNIFSLMKTAEKEEDIIGSNDIQKIENIFFHSSGSYQEKEIKILNLMRYGGWSGNSEGVKNIVSNRLLQEPWFEKENSIINHKNIQEFLESDYELLHSKGYFKPIHANSTNITIKLATKKNLLQNTKLATIMSEENAKALLKLYTETRKKLSKRDLQKELPKINAQREENWEIPFTLIQYRQEQQYTTIKASIETFKSIIIFDNVAKRKDRWNENTYLGMYANISWLWESELWDYLAIKDENIDSAIDFASTLAIGAMTMWVWWLAVKWAQWLLKVWKLAAYSNRSSKLAQWMYKTSKFFKAWKVLRYKTVTKTWKVVYKKSSLQTVLWNSALDGVTFHEGATFAQNLLFRDFEDLWKWLLDPHEIFKSMLFMWWLNSLKYLSEVKWLAPIMNFEMKIPKKYLEPTTIQKVLYWTWNFAAKSVRDWTLMFGISWAIEQWIWDGWNPSVEEYLHFIALIQVMHLKDKKIPFKKIIPRVFKKNQPSFSLTQPSFQN